jgi:hypothetical protein
MSTTETYPTKTSTTGTIIGFSIRPPTSTRGCFYFKFHKMSCGKNAGETDFWRGCGSKIVSLTFKDCSIFYLFSFLFFFLRTPGSRNFVTTLTLFLAHQFINLTICWLISRSICHFVKVSICLINWLIIFHIIYFASLSR